MRPCLLWFPEFFTAWREPRVLYSRKQMMDSTETLAPGSLAPEFLLPAANRDEMYSLSGLLSQSGALILEFLRGTW